MSNILYSVMVAPQEESDKLVIDSNQVMDKCIEERQKKSLERARYNKRNDEDLTTLDENAISEEGVEFEGFSEMEIPEVEASMPTEPEVDYVAEAMEEAERILEQARTEAQEILDNAEVEANAIRTNAEVVGQKSGYERGIQDAAMKQMEWENETEQLRQTLREDYTRKQESLEKDLVQVICSVVEKVFLIQFGDKKELIHHLLDNALSGIESSKSFLIRVNEENGSYLREHKEELQQKVGQEVVLDIVLDPLLDDSQCMIETDGGLFDCSMDVEMRNLIKDIKSLS